MKINKVLITDALRTVEKTQARFLSIIAIVALGISFFTGMNAVAPDMYDTAKEYALSSNCADIQIISTAGLTDDDAAVIASIGGVAAVSGDKFVDGVAKVNGQPINDIDGSEITIRAISLDVNKLAAVAAGGEDITYMNRPELIEGNWPTSANQCVVDSSVLSTPKEFQIGSTITIEGENKDVSSSLQNQEFTIVGIIRTPLYISYERGQTTIGTGKLGTFMYIPADNFLDDYYSALNIKLVGSDSYDPYSKEYDAFVSQYTDYLESIAPELLSVRVSALKDRYTSEVAKSEEEYANAKADTERQLAEAEEQVKTVLDMAENGDQKLLEYKQQYNEKATEAANAIDQGKLEHSTQYAQWEQKRAQYNDAKAKVEKYSGAEEQYNNAVTEYNVAKMQVNTAASTVDYLSDLVATTRSALDHFNDTQDGGINGIINNLQQSGLAGEEMDQIISAIKTMTAVGTAEEMAAYMEPQLQSIEVKLTAARQDLSEAQSVLAQKEAELKKAEQLISQLKLINAQLASAEVELAEAEKQLTEAGYNIQFGELEVLSQLSDMKNQIATYETNLTMAKEKASTIEAEFEAAKQEANDKLESARLQLEDAKQFLLGLEEAKWMVNPRGDALIGFDDYGSAAKRTSALSAIFPWFFFLVAALVCLNTMTRMVEEDRTRLGTFKALGFTDAEIMSKYLIYALLASLIGSVAGSFLGFAFFPTAVTKAYGILFDMPSVAIKYRAGYAFPGILISVFTTVFATYYTCRKSLHVVPSTLMRAKAPKNGKRILLEKIPAIWSRLSFTWKVTLRNVFRNMKRFVMATLGVMGCTAMLLAGFGLNDSINATLDNQFVKEDRVWTYDMQIVLNGSWDTELGECEAYNKVTQNAFIQSAMLNYMKVFNATSAKSDEVMESYLLVPEDAAALGSYVNLRQRGSKTGEVLTSEGAIITEKLAKKLDVGPGESLLLEVSDHYSVQIPIAGITENYAFHYIYLSKDLYQSIFGTTPKYNYITANLAVDNMTPEQKNELSKSLMSEYEISAVAYTDQIMDSFENILDSIGYIVIILIVAAALLAFTVLYNLSIINITERIKEIATLKVLGFDDGEVSAYIFRENVILTIIGTLEGLIMGIVLHWLVITLAEVDIIMYGRSISPASYLYAAVLAFAFSMLVNLVLHKKLKKVDMVESLKSIE
ncbi:MAG: ABC transporter permease [Oscillospiraceae bacterium]|nr:ABC transporter permease [Oscillospiraceae bacterium]